MDLKKVLIIAYDFPPYVSVGGLRPYSWYKYFKEFGIEPIVITRQWDNKYGNYLDYIAPSVTAENITEKTNMGSILRAPYFPNFANKLMLKYGDSKYRIIRKTITAFYEFAQFLFFVGPKSSIYFAANEYLSTNKVDVILATGDPFILFHYASKLSNKYNTPWIADYRDPWSQSKNNQKNIILKKCNEYFEKKTLKNVTLINTVNIFFKFQISRLIKNKQILLLPNGYDPEIIEIIKNIKQQNEILKIAYVGYIYDWHPLHSFLNVICNFIKNNKEVKLEINFFGINMEDKLKNMLLTEFKPLNNIINIHSKIPNSQLMQRLSKENIMLLFNYYAFPGTKIYDYIALNRLVLLCYTDDIEGNELKKQHYLYNDIDGLPNDCQEKLIRETNSGYIIKDSNELLITLERLYKEFIEKGFIKCNTINAEKYSRKHQVKELADIIKKISI